MLKHSLPILLTLLCLPSFAAGIGEIWVMMPDSLCPYLTNNQRMELLAKARAGINDTITNRMEGKSFVRSLAPEENRLEVQMTANLKWTLTWGVDYDQIEQTGTADVYLLLTSELCAPRCAVVMQWFDKDWRLVKEKRQPFETETEEEREPVL